MKKKIVIGNAVKIMRIGKVFFKNSRLEIFRLFRQLKNASEPAAIRHIYLSLCGYFGDLDINNFT